MDGARAKYRKDEALEMRCSCWTPGRSAWMTRYHLENLGYSIEGVARLMRVLGNDYAGAGAVDPCAVT